MHRNWCLIEAYRKTLKPGIYFFSAIMNGNTIIGIEETVEEYALQEDRKRYGVIFAYYPLSLPITDAESLTTFAEKTPQQFQIRLIEYLEKKIRSTLIKEEELTKINDYVQILNDITMKKVID